MNQARHSAGGKDTRGRSGALAEPRSVSLLNAARQLDIRRSEGESWMMVYLDVITLLLVAFVLVIAHMDKADDPERQESGGRISLQRTPPEQDATPTAAREPQQQQGLLPASDGLLQQNRLVQTLKNTRGLEALEVTVEPGQVNLKLPEKILFETGRAELIGQAGGVLEKIVPILAEYGVPISVEGHTDDVPIRTARFPSNWELSSARATMVLRYLLSHGVPRHLLRAVGYADTRPVASNLTGEGRGNNRRVNLVVHVDKSSS